MPIRFLYHPTVVHYPIALYFLEFLLILLWLVRSDASHLRFALFTFKVGFVFLILSMVTGFADIADWGGLGGKVQGHFVVSMLLFAVYTARALYWKFAQENWPYYRLGHLGTSAVGNVLMLWVGITGGQLVHF